MDAPHYNGDYDRDHESGEDRMLEQYGVHQSVAHAFWVAFAIVQRSTDPSVPAVWLDLHRRRPAFARLVAEADRRIAEQFRDVA